MTRRAQARETALKILACGGPTAVLVGAMFAIGGNPAAIAILVFGGLAALGLATSVRTVRAAVIGGLALVAGLVALLVLFAYVRSA
jgi:hypothetical protein